jgi:hypothetical protein
MGSITFTVVGDASVGTRTRTFTVPDAHVNRFVEWARWRFGSEGVTPTIPQALLAWAEFEMARLRTDVQDREYNVAKSAVTKPPRIEAT